MSRLVWDKTGERYYEAGTDHGVLYVVDDSGNYGPGVAWNGLTSVSEAPEGAEANAQYADNIKYLNLYSAEDFKATVEAFTFPDEFSECDGSKSIANGVYAGQQTRRTFAVAYRTIYGNDVVGQDFGYRIHLVYGAKAAPSEKSYETINDSPEAMTLSWELSTTPIESGIDGVNPTSSIIINSWEQDPEKLKEFEDILYGTEDEDPRIPMPAELVSIFGTEPYIKTEGKITVPSATTEFYGKKASTFQSNIRIDDSKMKITGHLNYIESFPEFSGNAEEAKGNFLCMNLSREPEDAVLKVDVTNGGSPEKTLDQNDDQIVFKIADNKSQKISIKSEYLGNTSEKLYDLTDLDCAKSA